MFFKDYSEYYRFSSDLLFLMAVWKTAFDSLAEIVLDDFQIMEEYKNNVSSYLKS